MNNRRSNLGVSKPPSPVVTRKRENRRNALIAILVLLVFLVGAIVFVSTQILTVNPTQFVDVPVIETHLMAADGGTHIFGTRVVLELYDNATEISPQQLHSEVLAAVASVTYEDISSANGMDILRRAVRQRLSYSFSDEELLGVYFAQFLSDIPLPVDDVPGRGTNIIFDAIFGE